MAFAHLRFCRALTRLNISKFLPYIALELISRACPLLKELQLYWPDRTIHEPGGLTGRLCHSENIHLPHLESLTIVDTTLTCMRDFRDFLPLASTSCLKKLSLVFEIDQDWINSNLLYRFTKLEALYLRPVPKDQLAGLSDYNIFLSDFRVEIEWFHDQEDPYTIFSSRTLHRLKHLRLSIRTYHDLWQNIIQAITKNLRSLETLYLEVPVALLEMEGFDLSPLRNLKRIHIFISITRSRGPHMDVWGPHSPLSWPLYFTM
jgi:hypothetical protein